MPFVGRRAVERLARASEDQFHHRLASQVAGLAVATGALKVGVAIRAGIERREVGSLPRFHDLAEGRPILEQDHVFAEAHAISVHRGLIPHHSSASRAVGGSRPGSASRPWSSVLVQAARDSDSARRQAGCVRVRWVRAPASDGSPGRGERVGTHQRVREIAGFAPRFRSGLSLGRSGCLPRRDQSLGIVANGCQYLNGLQWTVGVQTQRSEVKFTDSNGHVRQGRSIVARERL